MLSSVPACCAAVFAVPRCLLCRGVCCTLQGASGINKCVVLCDPCDGSAHLCPDAQKRGGGLLLLETPTTVFNRTTIRNCSAGVQTAMGILDVKGPMQEPGAGTGVNETEIAAAMQTSTAGDEVASGVMGGGGVYLQAAQLSLQQDVHFIQCSAPAGGGGGLLWAATAENKRVPVTYGKKEEPLLPTVRELGSGNTALYGPLVASTDHHSGTRPLVSVATGEFGPTSCVPTVYRLCTNCVPSLC